MSSSSESHSAVADYLLRMMWMRQPGHDEPLETPWLCPCGYGNVGSVCTKCGNHHGAAIAWLDAGVDRSAGVDSGLNESAPAEMRTLRGRPRGKDPR